MVSSEATPAFSFPDIVKANLDFEHDRPMLQARNHPGLEIKPHLSTDPDSRKESLTEVRRIHHQVDLSVIRKLLIDEISEFNGGAETGYFSRPENREDYRQQEVADMVLFALTYYSEMGEDTNGKAYEPDQQRIESRTAHWLRMNQIEAVPPTTPAGRVERFEPATEETFEVLKYALNLQADLLRAAVPINPTPEEIRATVVILERIIALCFAIFHLMKVNPIRQVFEKIGRNQIKHQARFLDVKYVPQLDENVAVEERKKKLEVAYRPQATKARDAWDGAPRADGERPMIGTDDFYSQGREVVGERPARKITRIVEIYDSHEMYDTIARALVSYGATWREEEKEKSVV